MPYHSQQCPELKGPLKEDGSSMEESLNCLKGNEFVKSGNSWWIRGGNNRNGLTRLENRACSTGLLSLQPNQTGRAGIKSLDMRIAYLVSTTLHILLPILSLFVTLLLMLILGMDIPDLFAKTKPEPKDLEFVLVRREQPEVLPIDPNTLFRAEKNMKAGGKSDPAKPVNLEEPVKPLQKITEPPPEKIEKPVPTIPPKITEKSEPKKKSSIRIPPVLKNSSELLPADTSPIANARTSMLTDTLTNPSSGNHSLGVDALREPDFAPYMKELQKRIKQSWNPPRGNESKSIVVLFRVTQEGELEQLEIVKSSGEPLADRAALLAVAKVFPFRPLPQEYTEEGVDIEFTFDYNVFESKRKLGKEAKRLNNS